MALNGEGVTIKDRDWPVQSVIIRGAEIFRFRNISFGSN